MRKLFVIATVMAAASSCLSVSVNGKDWRIGGVSKPIEAGKTVEQVRGIQTRYSGLQVSAGIVVNVTPEVALGTVVVRAGEKILDKIYTEVRGGRLEIGITKGANLRMGHDGIVVSVPVQPYDSFTASSAATIRLASEDYNADGRMIIDASSGARVYLPKGFQTQAMTVDASSSAKVEGWAVVKNGVSIDASSGANVKLAGSCTSPFEVEASSGSNVDCSNFECADAKCDASSGARISIVVNKSIAVEASSGAKIRYTGAGQLARLRTSSGASIERF